MNLKKTWRWIPCPSYDIEGIESWLKDMASRGLLLCHDGFFLWLAKFEKTDPTACEYRIDTAFPNEEMLGFSMNFGWDYVASLNHFYIYRSNSPILHELHTDPQVQAIALEQVNKKKRRILSFLFLYIVFLAAIYLRSGIFLIMLDTGSDLFLIGSFLIFTSFLQLLFEVIHLYRLKNRLSSKFPLRRQKNWKLNSIIYPLLNMIESLLFIIFITACFFRWSDNMSHTRLHSLQNSTFSPNFSTLEDFHTDAQFKLHETYDEYTNYYEIAHDLLADTVSYRQSGQFLLSNHHYVFYKLSIYYVEARTDWIAERLADEMIIQQSNKNQETVHLEDLNIQTQFASQSSFTNTIILQNGPKLVQITYSCSGPEEDKITIEEAAKLYVTSVQTNPF